MEQMLSLALMVTAALVVAPAESQIMGAELGHRRLESLSFEELEFHGHSSPPEKKHASMSYPVTKFSHLMDAACRPSPNGFFGSTSGTPAIIEYGFSLETTVFADADLILDIIGEEVMGEVLTSTFSDICPSRRRTRRGRKLTLAGARQALSQARVTGFKFEAETVEDSGKNNAKGSIISTREIFYTKASNLKIFLIS